MAEPTLVEAFGTGAAVATGELTIVLANLAASLAATPTAEAVIAAILAKAATVQDTDPSTQMVISRTPGAVVNRSGSREVETSFTVKFYTPLNDLNVSLL